MILIDGIFINNGGGEVLFKYLIRELNKTDIPIIYLFDSRMSLNDVTILSKDNYHVLNPSFSLERNKFYKANAYLFKRVLCFGNLPPNIKTKALVYTYFHQPLFLDINSSSGFLNKLLINLKMFILNSQKNNTDFWLVQSSLVREKLSRKYNIKLDKIKLLPFYPLMLNNNINVKRINNSFIYVSSGAQHKNTKRLILAFISFYDDFKIGSLTLTISSDFVDLINLISDFQKNGYPIKNVGFVKRDLLVDLYHSSEFLIFPSLAESFGLGIPEAIDCGCKVIGADLPYLHAVCIPTKTFDPFSITSIKKAIEFVVNNDNQPSVNLINNKIDNLVELLEN